jgi:asparagine synthase (glutamine-hydrolysing)
MDASLYLLFGGVRKRFPVCLTGEGADELFGGYPWYTAGLAAMPQTFPWRRYLCFPAELLDRVAALDLRIEEHVAQGFSDAMHEVPYTGGEHPVERQARAMTYLDLTRFLPGQLERKDRASMANSVEARVPYCDQELVQYVWNIPGSMKSCDGMVKVPLRDALYRLIPEKVRYRPKASYPTLHDPAHESYLRDGLREMLGDSSWPWRGIIDSARLAATLTGEIAPPEARASVWMGRLWSLYRWWAAYQPRLL